MSLAEYRALTKEVSKHEFRANFVQACAEQLAARETGEVLDCDLSTVLHVSNLKEAIALGRVAERILDEIKKAEKPKEEKKDDEKKPCKPVVTTKWEANNYDEIKIDEGGTKFVKNGQLHRIDGPARVWNNGLEEYFLNGQRHTKEAHAEAVKKVFKK